jgi:hypothetical protein
MYMSSLWAAGLGVFRPDTYDLEFLKTAKILKKLFAVWAIPIRTATGGLPSAFMRLHDSSANEWGMLGLRGTAIRSRPGFEIPYPCVSATRRIGYTKWGRSCRPVAGGTRLDIRKNELIVSVRLLCSVLLRLSKRDQNVNGRQSPFAVKFGG